MKILVFGNLLVKEDSLPLKLLPKLYKLFPQIRFKEFDAAENLEHEGRNLILLDTAFGINKVSVITDTEAFQIDKKYSMHDFDLAIQLKLLKKLKKIDSVKIIAVPPGYPKKKALEEVRGIISTLLSENG